METNAALIPTRSKRQAMDWSLVLASQGIETTIDILPEERQWVLLIEAQDYERAMGAIRQFRLENRGWNWQQKFEWSGMTFHSGVVFWCVFLGLVYWLDAARSDALRSSGAMDSITAGAGQWWRTFTAISLHSNLAHLAANLTTGFLLIGLAMARYGAGVGLLASYLAGALGNVAGLLFYQAPYRGLGASGMVMGALGLIAVQSLFLWRGGQKLWKFMANGILAGFLLFVLLGLDPQSDVVAHLGGFVAGAFLGSALTRVPPPLLQNYVLNLCSAVILIGLFLWTWSLALR
jgi:membrane associated rhomboid family serine protease